MTPAATDDGPATSPSSQTLSRGIRILEVLAHAGTPLATAEIAQELGVHRSIAYRLVRTLEDHGLVVRDEASRMMLGPRMAALAAGVSRDLQTAALPEMTMIANELGITTFLAVLDGTDCITLASVEPRTAVASMVQRPGARHPITVGAPGKVLLSMLAARDAPAGVSDELRAEVDEVVVRGYATSHDEIIPTVQSVAVPLSLRGHQPAAIAVVYVGSTHSPSDIAARLKRSALVLRDALGA